jgi:hypothetical protein
MFPYRVERTLGLWALIMAAGAGTVLHAGETPAEEALAKLGLKQAGTVLVLEAESEVHDKTSEIRRLARDLSNAVMLQRSTLSEKQYQDTIKELTAETNQFRAELNTTNQMISRLPKYRGRFMNNMVVEQNYELTMYKNQLQWEINQRTAFLNRLKSQPFDPKARLKRDYEVRDKQEAMHKAVLDLRQAVDATKEKYEEVDKDAAFKKVRSALERKTGTKLKLGPSRQFQLNVKLLERVEAQDSSGETGDSTAKGVRKTHRTTKGKRSTKAVGTGGPESPF